MHNNSWFWGMGYGWSMWIIPIAILLIIAIFWRRQRKG
jgi:cytochrome c-type biogenesis protein CcmH/NrfF